MEQYDFVHEPIKITYADALAQVSEQITGQLLVIGIFVVIMALWYIFGGAEKKEYIYQQITGALNMMLLVTGLYLIGLYAVVFWGWAPW